MGFPCEKIIDYSGYSTTEIIIELIKLCQNVSFIKQERINTIKHNIIEVDNRKQQWQNEMNARDNDADAFRSDDKYTNHKIANGSIERKILNIVNDFFDGSMKRF